MLLAGGGGGEINKKYIVKIFSPQSKKKERFIKSFFKGDYYLNLLKETQRIRGDGFVGVNDFYLLAEKKVFNYSNIFIMILEYIEGECISNIILNDEIKTKIKAKVEELHRHNMVMGDIQTSNFILSHGEIRIIDCSGKYPNAYRKAEDRFNLWNRLGIAPTTTDFYCFLVSYEKFLKQQIRLLKRKILYKINPLHLAK